MDGICDGHSVDGYIMDMDNIYKSRCYDLRVDLIDDPSASTAEQNESYRSISGIPRHVIPSAVGSTVDDRDIIYEEISDVKARLATKSTLPESFTTQHCLSNIRNQGSTSLAVPFAVTTLVEYHNKTKNHLSPRFIYQNRPRSDFRMELREALKMVKVGGVCREVLCPTDACLIDMDEERRGVNVNVNVWDSVTSAGAYSTYTDRRGSSSSRQPINNRAILDATNFRIPGYARVRTLRGAMDAIYHRGPLVVSMPCWGIRSRFWLKEYGESFKGGHCVNFVGWTPRGFIVRNSWGLHWAEEGYDIFPYVDWDEPRCYGWWEMWCIYAHASRDTALPSLTSAFTISPEVVERPKHGCRLV